ncbi:peroxidase 18 [Nymphaea colorata]|nr:peroxidase 18 [Nymphaea colorata]
MERKRNTPTIHTIISPLLFILAFTSILELSISTLSFDFYAGSCPNVELLVRNTVRSAAAFDQTAPAKLLRLVFHDCMVEGCDGSVLLEGNGTERADPANASLGGFQVVDSIKNLLEFLCPGTVSCADILALAARESVMIAGGPFVRILTGRRDGRVSSISNVRPNMVDTTFSMEQMAQVFSSKGLSMEDLVTLSGAHTIGTAHCRAFGDRFGEDAKGRPIPVDSSMDRDYAEQLISQCPPNVNPDVTVNNDPATAMVFDNVYYQNLMRGRGLFHSDSELSTDGRTRDQVQFFAQNQEAFFQSWANSFVRLTNVGVKTGDEGEVRRICGAVN